MPIALSSTFKSWAWTLAPQKKGSILLNIFSVYRVMRNKKAREWRDPRFNKVNMIDVKKTSLEPNKSDTV